MRDLLPGDALGEDNALQPFLPRRLLEEVAVRAGPVSAVPRYPVQDRQRREQRLELRRRGGGEQKQPEPCVGRGGGPAARGWREVAPPELISHTRLNVFKV